MLPNWIISEVTSRVSGCSWLSTGRLTGPPRLSNVFSGGCAEPGSNLASHPFIFLVTNPILERRCVCPQRGLLMPPLTRVPYVRQHCLSVICRREMPAIASKLKKWLLHPYKCLKCRFRVVWFAVHKLLSFLCGFHKAVT